MYFLTIKIDVAVQKQAKSNFNGQVLPPIPGRRKKSSGGANPTVLPRKKRRRPEVS